MKRQLLILTPIALLTSCVSYHKTEHELAVKTKFSSSQAAKIFYEAHLLPAYQKTEKNDQVIAIGLPTFPYSHTVRSSPQKRLNRSFRTADANQNGTVNLSEARAFSASKKKVE